MKLLISLVITCCLMTGCIAQSKLPTVENVPVNLPQSNEIYSEKVKSIQTKRIELADKYRRSSNKSAIFNEVRQNFITAVADGIIPFWYGTDWDFYGTTQTPKEGKIACGYFVTTILRDAGVKISRVSLAQQASENIIKSLTTAKFIKRFNNAKIDNFVVDIKKQGEGLYVVGLDNHVGFILNDGSEVWFIHSSYVEPSEVIKEKAIDSPILSGSKYRVTGRISADDTFLLKWLNQTSIATIRR